MRRWICTFTAVCALTAAAAAAGDWPAFRGPNGNGLSDEKHAPLDWSADRNVKWKAPLPGPGNGSPIVSGERVFVTCAEEDGKKRGLYCFNRADGSRRWARIVDFGKVMPTHKTNPYCATTPVTDGKHVVAWHGSAGLFCYDMEGKELWRRELGEFRHEWGYAASPIIYHDRVIQNCGPGDHAFVAAFDLKTGRELWRVDEPTDGDGRKRADGRPWARGARRSSFISMVRTRSSAACRLASSRMLPAMARFSGRATACAATRETWLIRRR